MSRGDVSHSSQRIRNTSKGHPPWSSSRPRLVDVINSFRVSAGHFTYFGVVSGVQIQHSPSSDQYLRRVRFPAAPQKGPQMSGPFSFGQEVTWRPGEHEAAPLEPTKSTLTSRLGQVEAARNVGRSGLGGLPANLIMTFRWNGGCHARRTAWRSRDQ